MHVDVVSLDSRMTENITPGEPLFFYNGEDERVLAEIFVVPRGHVLVRTKNGTITTVPWDNLYPLR